MPGCKTGYKSCKEKRSLFRAPKDPVELEKWRKAIQRADRILSCKDCVCELHFAPEWVSRSYEVVVRHEVCRIPRGCSMLLKGAVPHIFPNLPSYLSTTIASKRRPLRRETAIPRKVRKVILQYSNEAGDIQSEIFYFWSTLL